MEPESSRFEKGNKPTKHQFFEGSMLVCDPEKNKHFGEDSSTIHFKRLEFAKVKSGYVPKWW